MFRLLRLLLAVAIFGGLALVAVTVPLGSKTIWGHIKAIAASKESQEMVDGVKSKAAEVLDDRHRDDEEGRDGDQLTSKEREALRKLIRERLERERAQGKP